MKCLFVRAPFAGWIVDGVKTVEYRTRSTNIRGKIGIVQSKSGTVIGVAEITGCEWNDELEHYEWKLANAARFAVPVPFPPKNGAVVWIDVEVPEKRPTAPKLTAAELRKQKREYEEVVHGFLHPGEPPKAPVAPSKPKKSGFAYHCELPDGRRITVDSIEAVRALGTGVKCRIEPLKKGK